MDDSVSLALISWENLFCVVYALYTPLYHRCNPTAGAILLKDHRPLCYNLMRSSKTRNIF